MLGLIYFQTYVVLLAPELWCLCIRVIKSRLKVIEEFLFVPLHLIENSCWFLVYLVFML